MQNVLHDGEVGLPGIMHVEADQLDGIGDVRAGDIRYWRAPARLLK
jgi:hypothetical protein